MSPRITTSFPSPRIVPVHVAVDEAVAVLRRGWGELDVWPAATRTEAFTRTAGLLGFAKRHQVSHLDDLVGPLAERAIAEIAGVSRLGAGMTDFEREAVRPVRNTLLAIHATVAMAINGSGTAASEPAALPESPFPRTGMPACRAPRPWHDDEIALARIHFLAERHWRSLRAGNAYALLEAGAYLADASKAQDHQLDDPDHPTRVTLGPAGYRGDRQLELTAFGARLLARNLKILREAQVPALDRLCFVGANPASDSAIQSLQGSLNDHLAWAGIEDHQTNASGIPAWAQLQRYNAHGKSGAFKAAYGPYDQFTGAETATRETRLLRDLHIDARRASSADRAAA
jgi:hypothetical protein